MKNDTTMSTLSQGVSLIDVCEENRSENPRILLSSGVCKPNSNYLRYCFDAFVPASPWREPKIEEISILYKNSSVWRTDNCVGILNVPNELILPLENLGIVEMTNVDEYRVITKTQECSDALNKIAEYFSGMNARSSEIKILGINMSSSGKETVTYDPQEKCYIGLHLDSWDKLPLRQRYLARNRLCINLGREDRFLLFVNLTLVDMYNMLPNKDAQKLYSGTHVGYEFMRYYPSYPVVKLRIRPKEGYIAPTENIIHDGCSLEKQHPDITLTMLGHFGFW